MNADLYEVVKTYATKNHKEVSDLLLGKSKNNIISILIDLMTIYFNDKNSSTLREYVLVVLNGFTPNEEKIGYNGYKQASIIGESMYCEAKPKNVNTNDKKIKKLNGGGNFTDYTYARLERDIKSNPLMLIGGYINGRLIFNFRFPFDSPAFINKLKSQLQKRFPAGEDKRGEFLRSASFGLNDYINIQGIHLYVFVNSEELPKYKNNITAPLYRILEKNLK